VRTHLKPTLPEPFTNKRIYAFWVATLRTKAEVASTVGLKAFAGYGRQEIFATSSGKTPSKLKKIKKLLLAI